MKRLFISGGLLLLWATGKAQESEVELNPVTVTASLNPISQSQTGRNVLVIQSERIRQLPVNSIDELLRYLPGIEVQARGPMGTQSDFVLRGGTFQQVLVILDGIRVNDPVTGHFNSYIPIAPAEIDRIEILKGASSAIYGSEAVGGVIHVITKTFARKSNSDQTNVQAQVVGGEYGLFNVNAGAFYQKKNTAVSGGILTNNASGQLQRGTRGFFHNYTGSVSVSQKLNNRWQLSYRSAYDDRRFSAQNFYTTYASDTATEQVKTFWNQLKADYGTEKSHFNIQVGYKTGEDHYLYNTASAPNLNKSRLLQALTTYQHRWNNTVVTTGAQFQNRVIRSNDRGNHELQQAALFVLLDQKIGTNFHINPALRLDWNERGGTHLVPQLNASYHIANLQLRASGGTTIREADFTERYNNYNKMIVNSGSIGNPNLMSERSFSFEGGADYIFSKSIKVSASYFQRNHEDLIDWVTTPYADMPRKENLIPAGMYALAKNIATVTTRGFETDVQFSKKLSNNYSLWSSMGFLWLRSKSSEAQPSFYISSHARFMSNFNVVLNTPWVIISTNGIYKLRNPQSANAIHAKVTSDYFVLNGKAEVFVWKKKLSVVAQVDNIFDRSYSDLLGSPMPGRWAMAGAKLSL